MKLFIYSKLQILVFAILFCTFSNSLWAKVTATTSHTAIEQGESFTLTITVEDTNVNNIELDPIRENFSIMGSSRRSSYSNVNGVSTRTTMLSFELMPKQTGNLVIPAIKVDKEMTKPLSISVISANQAQKSPKLFLRAQISNPEPYVKEQVLYTLRIYTSIELHQPRLIEPKVPNGNIQLINYTNGTEQIDGIYYKYFERNYAIFADSSGEQIISQPKVEGRVITSSSGNGNILKFGSMLSAVGEDFVLKVKPVPQSIKNQHWLPANSLKFNQSWEPNKLNLRVGDAITASIKINVDGLLAEQIPDFVFPEVYGFKVYKSAPMRQNYATQTGGIQSSYEQNFTLLPVIDGKHSVPDISYPWYEIGSQQLQMAQFKGRSFEIAPSFSALNNAKPNTEPASSETTKVETDIQANVLIIAQLGISGLFLLVMIFFYFNNRKLKKLTIDLQRHLQSSEPLNSNLLAQLDKHKIVNKSNSRDLRKSFLQACQNNNCVKARDSLLEWAKCEGLQVTNLNQLAGLLADEQEAMQVRDLEKKCFTNTEEPWDGKQLSQLKKLQTNEQNKQTKNSELPSLYPN